jgi:hypothetical protein
MVRDRDGRVVRVLGQPLPQSGRVGRSLGEGREDRRATLDVAVDHVLVAGVGRGPLESVQRDEAVGDVEEVGDLLDRPPLVLRGVLGMVGDSPEVVLTHVPGVAVEVSSDGSSPAVQRLTSECRCRSPQYRE